MGKFDRTHFDTMRGMYISAGYQVIPLHGKRAYVKNWGAVLTDPSVYVGDFNRTSSAGFVVPDDVVVIDVDPRNFKGGDSLTALSAELKFDLYANAKFAVNTASGGMHLYYKKPRIKIKNGVVGFNGIEFKSLGRQVCIPGSTLPDGGEYAIIEGKSDLRNLSPAPDTLFALIETRWQNTITELNATGYTNAEADITYTKLLLDKRQGAEEGNGGDNWTFQTACIGHEHGLSPEVFFPILAEWNANKCTPAWDEEELYTKMLNAYRYASNVAGQLSCAALLPDDLEPIEQSEQWKDKIDATKNGAIVKSFKNTVLFMENLPIFKDKFKRNLFTNSIGWVKPMSWHYTAHDSQESGFVRWNRDYDPPLVRKILNEHEFDATAEMIHDAVVCIAMENRIHPVREFLHNLKPWDGVERIPTFFSKYCGAEQSKYTALVARKMFLAIITRVFNPGSKYDHMVIFGGPQGIRKSDMIKAIALKPEWFCDNIGDVSNKDVILQTEGKLVIEWPELNLFSKTDINVVKAYISRQVDRARNAFEKSAKDNPRQHIIIGTSNEAQYLKDETGNRRVWPISVNGFLPKPDGDLMMDCEGATSVMPQIYAEAIHYYKSYNGLEQLYLDDKEANKTLAIEHENRFVADEWESEIRDFLNDTGKFKDSGHSLHIDKENLTGLDIWTHIFGGALNKFDTKEQRRIARIMHRLGYISANKRIDGRCKKVYRKSTNNVKGNL